MGLHHGVEIVTRNLRSYFDAGNLRCDPRGLGGTKMTDLAFSNQTINFANNSTTWNSGFKGQRVSGGAGLEISNLSITSNQISICMWSFAPTTISAQDYCFWSGTNNDMPFILIPDASGNIYFKMSGTDVISKAATSADYGGFTFWVFTKNSTDGTMKIYRNGELWHSGTGKNISFSNSTFYLLAQNNGSKQYSGGGFAIIMIYDIELTEREIKQNFNATRERFGI